MGRQNTRQTNNPLRSNTLGGATEQQSTTSLLNPEQALLPAGMEEPEVRIAIQESTNRIFIYALQYQLTSIDEIMEYIDVDPEDALGQYEIFALENQTPEFCRDIVTGSTRCR